MRRRTKIAFLGFVAIVASFSMESAAASSRDLSPSAVLSSYAICIVDRHPEMVNAYLRSGSRSPNGRKISKAFDDAKCLLAGVGGMKIPASSMRWALYGTLYHSQFGKTPPDDLLGLAKLDFAAERDDMVEAERADHVYVRDFGDCVARARASDVHRLLLMQGDSAKEREELSALIPAFNDCLVGKGEKISFSRTLIRGILAEAMYKLRGGGGAVRASPS